MNFCTEVIGTRISVLNRVEADGHEVGNLLRRGPVSAFGSSNPGFMTAYFIRPPVTLRLEFPLPIDISHIALSPRVGHQVSTAFFIHTEIGSSQVQRSTDLGTSTASNGTKAVEGVTKHEIGKEYINDSPMPNTVVFRNPRFRLHRKYCNLSSLPQFEVHRSFPNSFQLKHPTYNCCERVVSLELTIQRVSGFSVPAIGFLEIWGQPGINATESQIENVLKLSALKAGFKRRTNDEPLQEKDESEPAIKKSRRELDPSEVQATSVPEEFLDPITFEMMIQPVRLPSGVAIDTQTLETYNREEAVWGRLQNDPFTGVRFSESLRPVPDSALKSRIDSFLTKHSNESNFRTLPRTVGSEQNDGAVGTSSRLSRLSHLRSICKGPKSSASAPVPTIRQPEASSSKEFMEQEMARILGGTTYQTRTDEVNIKACIKCEKIVTSSTGRGLLFYTSSCHHLVYCRNCLLLSDKIAINVCPTCRIEWRVSELSRIFT